MKQRIKTAAALFAAALISSPLLALDRTEIQELIADRPAADMERDSQRRPDLVLEFMGVEPGMTVIDLVAATGWYTEVLSHVVGPTGQVYSQNPVVMMESRNTEQTLLDRGLENVSLISGELETSDIAPGSIDFALTALNFHDVYAQFRGYWGEGAARGQLETVYNLLKPGGVFGLIDHAGNPGADNPSIHRIAKEIPLQMALDVGFEVEESYVLHNPEDDRTLSVFDASLRGDTDRFVLKLRKPE